MRKSARELMENSKDCAERWKKLDRDLESSLKDIMRSLMNKNNSSKRDFKELLNKRTRESKKPTREPLKTEPESVREPTMISSKPTNTSRRCIKNSTHSMRR